MNPFLKDPVAQPLGVQPESHWRATPKPQRISSLSRHTSVAMMAAGLTVGFTVQAMDVNTASVAQLESLKGIGPRTAKMIVHERIRAGAFVSMEDLSDRVRGLGVRRVRALRQAGLQVGTSDVSAPHGARVTTPLAEHALESQVAQAAKKKPQSISAKPEVISPQPF